MMSNVYDVGDQVGRNPRLRVTFVCLEWPNSDHSGGVARYSYRLASQLIDRVTLTVIAFQGGEPLAGAEMKYLPRPRTRVERFYTSALRVRPLVRSTMPDVVHAFGDDWAVPRGRWRHVRHFLGLSLSEARSSSGLRKLNQYVLALLEQRSKRMAAVRIGIAPESATAFDCQLIMPPVEPLAARARVPSVEPSLVFIGSFSGKKRGHLAEGAWRAARERFGDAVTLTVVGPESDAENWSPEIRHVSGASDDEVQEILAESWALLAPSSYEGFGIPVFEALSLGVRAITSPTPGSHYIEAEIGPSAGLRVVDDARFVATVLDTIEGGPLLGELEERNARRGVEKMLQASSVDTLIQSAYQRPLR